MIQKMSQGVLLIYLIGHRDYLRATIWMSLNFCCLALRWRQICSVHFYLRQEYNSPSSLKMNWITLQDKAYITWWSDKCLYFLNVFEHFNIIRAIVCYISNHITIIWFSQNITRPINLWYTDLLFCYISDDNGFVFVINLISVSYFLFIIQTMEWITIVNLISWHA